MRIQTSIPDLEPTLLSAKRSRRERSGVHLWMPYYAGYSESFVESAIDYLSLNSQSVVLDPWNGSGTTGLLCEKNRIKSIGLDINPAMTMFAAAKTGVTLSLKKSITSFLARIRLEDPKSSNENEQTLREIFSPSLCSYIGDYEKAVSSFESAGLRLADGLRPSLSSSFKVMQPDRAFLYCVLFVTLRQLSGYMKRSNPTWFVQTEKKLGCSRKQFLTKLNKNAQAMLSDLEKADLRERRSIVQANFTGDSRKMPIRDGSVDAVITSPPYLTRIDYAVSTTPELLILSGLSGYKETRINTMGAPVITGGNWRIEPAWGRTCSEVLEGIRDHATKAAKSYYFKNICQYFFDAHNSVLDIFRVLKSNHSALVVVQSSYFKEINIPLGQIYVEMADKLGHSASIVRREVVKGHLAHVNTKSSGYVKNKVYFEDVVCFVKK